MGSTVSADASADSVETSVSSSISEALSFSTFHMPVESSKTMADDRATTSYTD